MHLLVTHWPWLVAATFVLGVPAIVFRSRIVHLLRLGKALATDRRLPPPVRWLFRVALVIKAIPGPDLGIDEALLVVGVVLLAGPYRSRWREIRDEQARASSLSAAEGEPRQHRDPCIGGD